MFSEYRVVGVYVCMCCIADTDDSVLGLVSAVGQHATSQRADTQAIASVHVGVDADVIENCTAALSSLASSCDDNCTRISEAGGIEVLVALTGCKCVCVCVCVCQPSFPWPPVS